VAFEQAAVLPIALATSAAGLFQEDGLNFPLPSAEEPKPTGKTLLVWGGASSVGSAAIQLAVAAGLTVISTASSKNFELVKSLGASAVYDYKSPTIVEDVVRAISGTDFAGVFDAISETPTFEAVRAILAKLESNAKVVITSPYDKPTEQPGPKFGKLFLTQYSLSTPLISFSFLLVIAVTVAQDPHKHVAKAIWKDFVPKALENGRLKTKPNPEVVGKGLQDIQHAVDVLKEGVSAKKIIVNF
jgi:NADPH:quinone reductase-like Zn-dependent oxidoreductase